jgi:hypothetical protein
MRPKRERSSVPEPQAPPDWFLPVFPFFFVGLWLAVAFVLNRLAGWSALAAAYPDTKEDSLAAIRFQSGRMGRGVDMNGILTLAPCRGGLRVGMMRLFNPFSPSFLVPWSHLRVERRDSMFGPKARLLFGNPPVGTLEIARELADRLARHRPQEWPEAVIPEGETHGEALRHVVLEWAAITAAGAAFFILAPRIVSGQEGPPWQIAVGLPALFFGIRAFFRYLGRIAP